MLPLGVVMVATGPSPPGMAAEELPPVSVWPQPARTKQERTARGASRAALRRVSCIMITKLLWVSNKLITNKK